MTTRGERVESLFHEALDLQGEERERFLRRSCADDSALRREVEGLLQLDAVPDPRLDASAPEMLALGRAGPIGLLVGRRLGPYRLRRCLAAGGMGAVYEATEEDPHRTVAVKVLRGDVVSADLERRFRVEASFLARLQHPAIAHVYGAGLADVDGLAVPYIAMELVEEARSITTFAAERGLDLAQRLALLSQVCDAVQHGHQRGVLHRDLKPANILVDAAGRPKLIDFGVARALDPEGASRRTEAGVFLGTVQYVSPEQCRDARDLDVRSDVYSLGVVVYELLCGRLPYDFEGVPLPLAARIVQERPPRRPSTHVRALRGDLETILLKALEKDRGRRYQSAAELGDDLQRFLRREPIAARTPSWAYRLALLAARHRVLVAALAAIFVVTLGAAVVSARFAWNEHRAREREERQATLANLAAADAALAVHDPAAARRRLSAVPVGRRGWEWRYLAGRLDLSQRVFVSPGATCLGVGWSGGLLASAWAREADAGLVLWEAKTGVELARSPPLPEIPSGLALLDDGTLVWGDGEGVLRRWTAGGGEVVEIALAHEGPISAVRRAGPREVLTASADGTVGLWDVPSGRLLARLGERGVGFHDVALGVGREHLALAGDDGSVRLLDLATGREERVLRGHVRAVLALDFAPDGRRLASGSRDGTVRLWDLGTGRELQRLVGHESEVRAVRYVPDGTHLVSASDDRTLRVWAAADGSLAAVLWGHTSWVSCLALAPDGRLLASGSSDGTLRLWDPLRPREPFATHAGLVRALAFSPDGRRLATASFDGSARVFDVAARRELRVLAGHEGRVMSVAFAPDGARLATGGNDRAVCLWDAETGELLRRAVVHADGVHAVAFAPDGALLASGSKDGRVCLLEPQALAVVGALAHDDWLEGLAFDADGRRLATVTRDGVLRLWDLASRREQWRQAQGSAFGGVAFSPDGARLATTAANGSVHLWDARTGEPRAVLVGHTGSAHGVAFSPHGQRLASVGEDGSVRLWDPGTGEELLTLAGHESWVFGVAFSPDGERLATAGGNYDGTGAGVRLWEAGGEIRAGW